MMQLKSDDKIYLLDDNLFYINIFQQHLVNLGYSDISIFDSPAECYNKMTPPPNIIIYDRGVDFLKDLEVLKNIKRKYPDIYLIFMCGQNHVAEIIQSLKYGAFDYFVKGEQDAKNIEFILTKIQRVRELLHKHNIGRVQKSANVNSKGELKLFPNK